MALDDQIRELREELILLDSQFTGIGDKIKEDIALQLDLLPDTVKNVAKSFQNDLSKAIDRSNKALNKQDEIANKIKKGQNVSKEIEKEINKVQNERQILLRKAEALKREGVIIDEQQQEQLFEALRIQEEQLSNLNAINAEQIAQRGITGNIIENAKEYLTSLDKSGLAAALLSDNLSNASKFALLTESAFLAIAKGALEGSNNINNLQKNLGISYESAYDLQNSIALTAINSEKLFITSKDLNKSFTDLAAQTGIISDFGGDTLVTMTTLTKQLGLGVKEASQLSLLARTQGEDTEGVLENTVETVNAINRQRNSAISAKAVLNDIATASASIVVSLGMSPQLLAEAATEARALGLSLEEVDKIAGSLLDFESSIENELKFQMLTGKEINLDKARQLALDNDLAGLSEEIAKNSEITEAFATGNRIQQQAAADALGMSRDELAQMVTQQELLNLSKDDFIAKYGEQSYQDMQAMSASKNFAASLEKIKGVIGDIGAIFSPIIDGFAKLVGYLAESAVGAAVLAGVMASLAAVSIVKSIADTISSFTKSGIPFAAVGGIAAAAGIIGLVASARSSVQSVEDGIADSSRGPFTITDSYGKMAMTAKGDNLAVSPNVSKGGGSDSKMLSVLEQIAKKDSNVYMDSSKVGYAESLSYSKL